MTQELHTWLVRVAGRVQGVYYRASTQQRARELGIAGWVRNEADGAVSALLQHSDEAVLRSMLDWMRAGPPGARVDRLECRTESAEPTHTGFEIRR